MGGARLEFASARNGVAHSSRDVHGRKASAGMSASIVQEDRIARLESKIDFIVEELSHLRRVRNSAEDLVADLTIVGKDAMSDATEALGSTTLRPQELAHLVKTVLRDAGLLTTALQQLESAADFVDRKSTRL